MSSERGGMSGPQYQVGFVALFLAFNAAYPPLCSVSYERDMRNVTPTARPEMQ